MTYARTSQSSLTKRTMKDAGFRISYEFFPPSSELGAKALWKSLKRLEQLDPAFVSVTYGAGGSTRKHTSDTVVRMLKETSLNVAAHLTCVDATKEEVDSVIREYWRAGVRNFVALRGDSKGGPSAGFKPTTDGYQNAAELVAGLKAFSNFDITVAAYPEKHPMSPDFAVDIDMLKRKVDNGATRAITQFFFDNDMYEAFVEKVRAAGIYIPIVPGILPVHNFTKVKNFASKCHTHIPVWLEERFEGLDNDPKLSDLVASAVASEQVMDLVERGVEEFHFYTMNKAELVHAICHQLGMRGDNSGDSQQKAA